MATEKQILASPANGAKSRGPKTPRGKSWSSQNALRHGLLANCVVLRCESREAFEIASNEYMERFQPADEVEVNIVEEMIAAAWRLRRAWTIETMMFDSAARSAPSGTNADHLYAAFTNLAASPQGAVLHRYESRLNLIEQRARQTRGAQEGRTAKRTRQLLCFQ